MDIDRFEDRLVDDKQSQYACNRIEDIGNVSTVHEDQPFQSAASLALRIPTPKECKEIYRNPGMPGAGFR